MRNTFIHSYGIKIHDQKKKSIIRIWQTFGKHFLSQAGCGSISSAKSCRDTWRSSSWLARGQRNMADEAKPCSPILSAFEVLVVWCVVGHCHGELGPLCWSTESLRFSVHLICEHTSQMKSLCWDSESCRGSYQQQTTKLIHDLVWFKFSSGKCFGTSWCSHWTSWCRLLYAVPGLSHVITERWFIVAYNKKRQPFKTTIFFFFFFWFVVRGIHL